MSMFALGFVSGWLFSAFAVAFAIFCLAQKP
jgi:hypothetical protein